MLLKAYAKINLSLDIINKRPDGYHNLDTVMQTVSLYDTIDLTKNKDSKINLGCSRINLPIDRHNTAYMAAELMLEHCKEKCLGVNIHICKNIPSEAGLGGGSADAAAVINGMNKLFELNLTNEELVKIGARVGADVPFCLNIGTARCEGIGEIISTVDKMPDCHILICKPPVGISTAEAYRASDKFPQDGEFMTESVVDSLKTNDINTVAENISNRFDEIMCVSEVQVIKSIMTENGALGACMTGSGSAVFGIYTDEEVMKASAKILQDVGEVFMCKPLNSVE